MMVSYLYHYFGETIITKFPFLFEGIDNKELEIVLFMLKNKMNSPLTSSAGRLFDSVSALLNVCRHSSYHAEAPMRLEAMADTNENDYYSFKIGKAISMKPAFQEMIKDLKDGFENSRISAKFHNTIIEVINKTALLIRENSHINKIALSGGTFQNRIIIERTETKLKENGFEVYTQSSVPSNDGGIALGQLAIAAKRRELGLI